MILSDQTIRLNGIVTPCEERGKFRGKSFGLSHCGYDIRADLKDVEDWHEYRHVMTPDGDGIALNPGQSVLLAVREHFSMPPGVVGFVKDKSTWARQGLFTSQAVLEPGWRGYLSIRVANLGSNELVIVDGEPIAQVVFQWIDNVPERTYTGKYQGQERGPQGPRFEE